MIEVLSRSEPLIKASFSGKADSKRGERREPVGLCPALPSNAKIGKEKYGLATRELTQQVSVLQWFKKKVKKAPVPNRQGL